MEDIIKEKIALNLHRLMAKTGISRNDLAELSKVGANTISQLMNCKGSFPKPETIRKLATALGVDVDEFYK